MTGYKNFNQKQPLALDNKEDIKKLLSIKQQKDVGGLIEKIRNCVKSDLGSIKANQLRNIYDESMNFTSEKDFQLFRPKLAYITGRMRETETFVDFIDNLITSVKTTNSCVVDGATIKLTESDVIENLHTVLESIVAYHKYFFGDK